MEEILTQLQKLLRYCVTLHQQAVTDIRSSLHAHPLQTLLIMVAVLFLGDLFALYWRGQPIAEALTMENLMYGLIPTSLLFLGFYVLNLIMAPFRLDQQFKERMEELKEENAELRERLCPKLSIFHKEGHQHPWFQVQHAPDETQQFYTAGLLYYLRITLVNSGLETIRRAQVSLTEIDPPVDHLLAIPCTLQVKNTFDDHCDVPMTDPQHRDGVPVDIVRYFIGDEGSKRMWVCHLLGGVRADIPVQECKLRLTVTSDNGGETISRWFRISFDEFGTPKMELLQS